MLHASASPLNSFSYPVTSFELLLIVLPDHTDCDCKLWSRSDGVCYDALGCDEIVD